MKLNPHLRRLQELILFSLFGAMMFLIAQVDTIPNVHQLGPLIAAFTVVYRHKALFPIYVYVLLEGWLGGFGLWWYPYLYLWTVLWLFVILLPRKLKEVWAGVLLTLVTTLHGLAFGLLYAPFQCYAFLGGNWETALSWWISGLPFDLSHALGNLAASLLTLPLIRLLCRLQGTPYPYRKRRNN